MVAQVTLNELVRRLAPCLPEFGDYPVHIETADEIMHWVNIKAVLVCRSEHDDHEGCVLIYPEE